MRISNLSALALLGLVFCIGARGAELLYFFSPSCGYCKAFDEEVGEIYPKSTRTVSSRLQGVCLSIRGQSPRLSWLRMGGRLPSQWLQR